MVNNTAQQISVIVSIKSGIVNCYPSIEFVENNFLVISSYNLEMLAQCQVGYCTTMTLNVNSIL